jgi:hypothetical protein
MNASEAEFLGPLGQSVPQPDIPDNCKVVLKIEQLSSKSRRKASVGARRNAGLAVGTSFANDPPMTNSTRLAIASLLVLPLAACDGVKVIPGLAPDQAPKALAGAICPAAYRCCMADQLMNNAQAGTDVASCEMKSEAGFQGQVAGIQESEQKGRVVYDGEKVQKCVDYLKTAPCSELTNTGHFTGLPACASFIQPLVEKGGACAGDVECKNSFCDRTGLPDGQDGVCRDYANESDDCSGGARCAYNLRCDPGTSKCVPLPTGAMAQPGTLCFYSSACSYAGGDRGAFSLLGVGLLLGAAARRRRSRD